MWYWYSVVFNLRKPVKKTTYSHGERILCLQKIYWQAAIRVEGPAMVKPSGLFSGSCADLPTKIQVETTVSSTVQVEIIQFLLQFR